MKFELLQPNTPEYETARQPQIAEFADIKPAAIARCRTPAHVAGAIAYARERGHAVAIRSGGHCFAGRSSTTGVVIDVSPMDDIAVGDGTVTVGAGARLGRIYGALEPHGLAIAGGCGPTVGIAGLALGGGLGILGRRHGLTCDQMIAAEIVLADGRVVACDDDVLWALRGSGGGQFGVVTSLTFRTVPAPHVKCFHLTWPRDRAADLISAWQQWAPDAPDEVAASLLVTSTGVHLFGAGRDDLLPGAATRTIVELPFRAAKHWLAEHGPGEAGDSSKSEFFRTGLPPDAIAALVENFTTGELDFSPWGGAYNRVAPDATAFPHRAERFLLKQTGERGWLQRSYEITHPHGSGGAYVNFPDPDLDDPLTAYHGANLDRLQRVKAAYDPDDVFRFPQSIPVAGGPRSAPAARERG
jgi:FAD/FMN-containing dehydrogenase